MDRNCSFGKGLPKLRLDLKISFSDFVIQENTFFITLFNVVVAQLFCDIKIYIFFVTLALLFTFKCVSR